jgi:hypothetical protein
MRGRTQKYGTPLLRISFLISGQGSALGAQALLDKKGGEIVGNGNIATERVNIE